MSEQRWVIFIRVWALLTLILFAVTWRLWGLATEFPQVALLSFAQSLPQMVDWACAILLACSLVGLLIVGGTRRSSRFLFACVSLSLGALFLLNQHRLQPWAWQTFIFSILFAVVGADRQRRGNLVRWLGWILISIYLYSALSKFDYQFLHSTGEDFLGGFLSLLGISHEAWSANQKLICVSLFPIGELLIGLGLMLRVTRKWAVTGAISLHASLILVLSPLGLRHEWAVLIWNAQFIFFLVFLFGLFEIESNKPTDEPSSSPQPSSSFFPFGLVIAIAVIALPLLKPIGLCDHWLAWGLYSPSNSRSELRIPATVVGRFPSAFQSCLERAEDAPGVYKIDLGKWSLIELSVPVYPQARFQTAAAKVLIEEYNLETRAQLIEYSESDFWTGKRKRTEKNIRD